MENEKPNINEQLRIIQQKLNAPKDLYNEFGKYQYRSCESILKAVKPLLAQTGTTLMMSDKIILIGDRFYVQSTAELRNDNNGMVYAVGFAREDLAKKGMDGAQLTGATSSYARKYALNALFAIDDNKDSDTTNKHKTGDADITAQAVAELAAATSTEQVKAIYAKYSQMAPNLCGKQGKIYKAVINRGSELKDIEDNK